MTSAMDVSFMTRDRHSLVTELDSSAAMRDSFHVDITMLVCKQLANSLFSLVLVSLNYLLQIVLECAEIIMSLC